MKSSPLVILSALFCALTGIAESRPIAWGSGFHDLLFDANGSALSTAFSFEVGTFDPGFAPTPLNVHQWAANWQVFDRSFDPDANGWNAVEQFFTGFATHQADGTSDSPDALPTDVFVQGTQVYLWAYDTKTVDVTSQWALVSDVNFAGNTFNNWLIPDPLDVNPGTLEWNLADADTAVLGGVNNIQYAGAFMSDPPVFSLQTAFLTVPEPGGALLIAVTGFLVQVRRRRGMRR